MLKKLSVFPHRILRTKNLRSILSESDNPLHGLKKVLGPFDLILLGIGVIIGAGIFATVGTAAAGDALRPGAGPALILSFAITAVVCGFAALCYAELASLVPISGSAYTYSYATFGEIIAWIIGWDLMLEYGVGSIAVSISWSSYFIGLLRSFGIIVPQWAIAHNLPAIFIVAVLTYILFRGIKESARFNMGIVITKLLVLAFFILVGAFFVKPGNWVPFAPNGFAGIKAGAAIAFFAYIGFDCLSTTAEETRNPKRDLPIGIIGSLIICTIIYMTVTAIFTGIIPFDYLKNALSHQKAEPLALAMQYINLNWATGVVAVGAVIAQIAVLLVLMMGQARIFFSMARDGLLPSFFSRVHHRFRTPYVTTIITGVLIALFAAFTNIEEMVDLTNIGTLFAFVLVCLGVIILRYREPDLPRGFKVPFSPITPLLGAGCCIFLMTGLPMISWYRFVIWLVLGLVVYFSYGIRHSNLHKHQ
ncbi:MAG TPA: amino acid permease [Candidatus Omnitrophota bacterium]|nr:amino acid permease [Candidatus Omnitrophota bacterium]